MAGLDVVTLNEVQSRLDVPQVGDNYNMPRDLVVAGDVASTTSSPGRLDVGGNVASATGRAKVNAVEFSDGTVALTAQALGGSPSIDGVLGQGNTTLKRMSVGGIDIANVTATLPPITIVASDDFDNSQDSAWIDRCADKSWELEARSGTILATSNYANATAAVAAGLVTGDGYYNTTTAQFEEVTSATTSVVTYRAGSRKFPLVGLVTAEAGRVIIWDTTRGRPEMWMVFGVANAGWWQQTSKMLANGGGGGNNVIKTTSVRLSGSHLLVGRNIDYNGIDYGALNWVDFVSEKAKKIGRASSLSHISDVGIASRNQSMVGKYTTYPIVVLASVNAVAITYLPDAPLDEYGMRVPTIAVGCGSNSATDGLSVIKHDGTVVSFTKIGLNGTAYYGRVGFVQFVDNLLYFTQDYITMDRIIHAVDVNQFTTNLSADWNAAPALPIYMVASQLSPTQAITSLPLNAGGQTSNVGASLTAKAYATNQGLYLLNHNPTTPSSGMVAYLTNTYNSGWLVGDIRRAFLCNSLTADRSVKGGALTMTGTVTETVNSGGVNVYSGFSAANYFSEASHADWNALGTGDFSIIMSGVKWGTSGTYRGLVTIGGTSTVGGFGLAITPTNQLGIWQYTSYYQNFSNTTIALTDVDFHSIVVTRTNGIVTIYVDSVLVLTYPFTRDISTTSNLMIGNGIGAWLGGQVSQVRISATAPTAEQIKHMYETERKLFEPNAKALLSSSPNVTDLKYSKQHDTHYVKNGTNVDEFKGLQRTDSMALATGVTTSSNPLAAPMLSTSGTTNIFKAPAVDMLRDLKAVVRKPKTVLLDFNVVVNGKFSTASGWTLGAGWSIAGGVLTKAAGTASTTTNTPTVKAGIPYVTTFTVATITAGSVRFDLGGTTGVLRTIPGTYTDTKTPTTSSIDVYGDALFAGTIDNLSVRESTDTLPKGFKPKKVWAGGLLQELGTDYDVTFDGFLYGVNFFIEPSTNVQVEGEQI